MRIYAVQMDLVWEDAQANHGRLERLLDSASLVPGSLVVLPELFCSGFSMNTELVCEGANSGTEQFMATTARKHEVFLVGGMPKAGPSDKGFNQSLAFSPKGTLLCRYSKMHPFSLGGESSAYLAGEHPCLFGWHGVPVSTFICYDLRFPEVFRTAVLMGAKVITVIANWPDTRLHHWVKLLQARAIENQATVVGVNRVGNDPRYPYSGRSLIVDHHGNIQGDAGNFEAVISADFDLDDLEKYRAAFPALQDIRADYREALG